MNELLRHAGACHCGALRFEVEAPAEVEVSACNCSICGMTGFLHLIVPRARFHLHQGQAALAEYRFGTGVARHTFCRRCGIKAFYRPRSHPEGVSVNLRCLDRRTFHTVKVVDFDGQHWEEAIEGLRARERG